MWKNLPKEKLEDVKLDNTWKEYLMSLDVNKRLEEQLIDDLEIKLKTAYMKFLKEKSK